jgi:hypothetical protein
VMAGTKAPPPGLVTVGSHGSKRWVDELAAVTSSGWTGSRSW